MEGRPGDLEGLASTTSHAIQRESESTATSIAKETAPVAEVAATAVTEDAPDPEEDDLDDLDDMLDEFVPSKPEIKAPAVASGPGKPPTTTTSASTLSESGDLGEDVLDDDFAKQLQAGMAELMGGLDSSPEMKAQLETMMRELGGAAAFAGTAAIPSPATATKDKGVSSKEKKVTPAASTSLAEESFQETIAKTMERMRTSGDQATAAAASENSDDILAEMMKAMQASGGLDGEGGEEEFSKMLLGMMEQLTNKDILYEPMKELDDKFPAWMEKNAKTTEAADLKRYKEQQVFVKEIVDRFEAKGYKDENAADREYIVERMQKMQAAGSPPADLVGDMAAAQEAFGAPEEGCPTQ